MTLTELEALVRSRASGKWLASEDFSETIGHMRRAFQIPGVAHCALEYQRWAVRSQLRSEGRRFMHAMDRPLGIPLLHMHGEADPYVLAAPVERTRHYAPHGRFVSLSGAGHFGHEEVPEQANGHLSRFLTQAEWRGGPLGHAGSRRHPVRAAHPGHLARHLVGGEHEPGFVVVDRGAEHHAEHLTAAVDQRPARITLPHHASDRVHLAVTVVVW